jgi:hypothetical protein
MAAQVPLQLASSSSQLPPNPTAALRGPRPDWGRNPTTLPPGASRAIVDGQVQHPQRARGQLGGGDTTRQSDNLNCAYRKEGQRNDAEAAFYEMLGISHRSPICCGARHADEIIPCFNPCSLR